MAIHIGTPNFFFDVHNFSLSPVQKIILQEKMCALSLKLPIYIRDLYAVFSMNL